jgi:hypothetical protein
MTKLKKLKKLDLVAEILKDPDRKPLFTIIYELFSILFKYRELPKHYFSRYLFKKGITNVENYLPNKFLGKIPSAFNNQKVKEVLDNKLYFDLFYSQFDLALPKILLYNHKNIFIAGNRSFDIRKIDTFISLLQDIFKQNPSCESLIIKKTYASSGGNNIYKLSPHQVKSDPEILNEIYNDVTRSEFIFQVAIQQHSEMNRLNYSSLNTIRIDTFIDKDGKIDVLSGFLRMSVDNSYVDNISSGGCRVGVDLETGRLKKYGYFMIKTFGVRVLTEHPVTKTVFEDFKIPYIHEVKELVIKAAGFMPELRLVGWDVGIGESGPVLIEGNSDYGVDGNDTTYGGYLTHPTFRKVLSEINYLKE